MITFAVVVGIEGDADVLDDADQRQGPEHDAVDSQVVLFGWVCQVHGRVDVERGGDKATEYDAQSLVGKEQILVESFPLLIEEEEEEKCWRELSSHTGTNPLQHGVYANKCRM